MKKVILFASLTALLIAANPAFAKGREPCSGKKGGISHCQGKKFVCNNGTISASKKICNWKR